MSFKAITGWLADRLNGASKSVEIVDESAVKSLLAARPPTTNEDNADRELFRTARTRWTSSGTNA